MLPSEHPCAALPDTHVHPYLAQVLAEAEWGTGCATPAGEGINHLHYFFIISTSPARIRYRALCLVIVHFLSSASGSQMKTRAIVTPSHLRLANGFKSTFGLAIFCVRYLLALDLLSALNYLSPFNTSARKTT